MSIKLLIADVDGTLVTRNKLLTERTCDAVTRLRAAGVDFTITSGRPPRGLASLIAPLNITAPVAAFNGGMYVKPDLTTIIAQRTMRADVAREAIDYLFRAGLDVWVYQGADWYIRNEANPRIPREKRNVGFDPIIVSDFDSILQGPVKLVGISDDLALVAMCEAELNARLGADALAARSQPYYLDITHPEANKGMVVREAARILQIPLSAIASIGDMLNDLPMLRISGLSIAMGNASEEVKNIARYVTKSNEEEGFAHAVDSFILGEPPISHTAHGLPPHTRACLFGLDGVLAQTAKLHAEAWKELFDLYLRERAQAAGIAFVPFDPVSDFSVYFYNKLPLDGIRSFLDSRGIEVPSTTVRALAERKSELLLTLFKHERVEPYEGSVRYVRAARAAGLKTAVVSSSRHCHEALDAAGIADLFDAEIDGEFATAEHLAVKPAPDIYLAAAQAVGVDFEDAVVFDDDIAGVEAGRAGHFGYVVGIDRTGHSSELRSHGADVVVADLASLLNGVGATAH
jgi:Cof subfamily protein (haloacid dehalogenase superfamily)/HAD superfamily hydrolase (TIGR01509 family)